MNQQNEQRTERKMKREFNKNNVFYSVIRTDDVTSDGTPVFKVSAWNDKGQQIGIEEIAANSAEEVKHRILTA